MYGVGTEGATAAGDCTRALAVGTAGTVAFTGSDEGTSFAFFHLSFDQTFLLCTVNLAFSLSFDLTFSFFTIDLAFHLPCLHFCFFTSFLTAILCHLVPVESIPAGRCGMLRSLALARQS